MNQKILAFKSNLPSLFVLEIYKNDLNAIVSDIKAKKKASPMMFAGLQVLIDLSASNTNESDWDLVSLRNALINESILPIAIMTDNAILQQSAIAAQFGVILPILRNTKTQPSRTKDKSTRYDESSDLVVTQNESSKAEQPATNVANEIINSNALNKVPKESIIEQNQNNEPKKTGGNVDRANVYLDNQVIHKTVRSGQRVYSKGDLTILGSVSAGAEIIADGNIHVYGALNGRAMAGASDNVDACIFCRQMNAEIVAIAGHYWSFEEEENKYQNESVVISLQDEQIVFSHL